MSTSTPAESQYWSVPGIMRTMLPVLTVLTVVELGSGLVLNTFEETLLSYPTLLVLVPVTIGMGGNLGSILAARLSTAFHLGILSFATTDDRLGGNAIATLGLALTIFPLVGGGAWLLQSLLGGTALTPGTVVGVALVSGLVLAVLSVLVAVGATYVAYRLGLNPDDVVIPLVTNTCDVLGVLVLFAVVRIFVG